MPRTLTRRQAFSQFALFLGGSPLLRGQLIPREAHERVPSLDEIANVLEFEPVARGKITQTAYDFVAGGVETEYTLRRNREAFNWVRLIPRRMTDVSSVDLSTEILGQRLDSPLLIAPTAGHQQLHPEGEKETHRGATAARVTMVVSSVSSFPLDQISAAAEGPLWFQLYVHQDLDLARERVERAVDAGCRAICWTVDAQYSSLRERLRHDRHLIWRGPAPSVSRRRRRRRRRSEPPNPYRVNPESPDQDWSFIETLHSWTDLPVLVKGILTAEDAKLAAQHGAEGIVVSNHGARYLAYTPSTIEVLPEIVEAVEDRISVLIDGGFRRGSDILKGLSLGAKAMLLGRPPLWGLGAYGAAGVQRALEILQAELAVAMAHVGCSRVADIHGRLVEADFP